jgi:holo-[acyl-carrier protein] synthase
MVRWSHAAFASNAMIVGTGTDLTEIARIAHAIERHGDSFLHRIYTAAEISYCQRKVKTSAESYAARFAAKEAGAKALGTGIAKGVSWREIEVTHLPGGRPALLFHGRAAERAAAMGVTAAHLSLSHGRDVAIAMVVLES